MKSLDEYFKEEEAKRVAEMHTPEAEAAFAKTMEANRAKVEREMAAVPVLTPYENGREAFLRGETMDECPYTETAETEQWVEGWNDADAETDE